MMRFEQVHGCLLGQAVADSVGATYEGQDTQWLRGRFENKHKMFRYSVDAHRNYTDDTEMAFAVARYLATHGAVDPHKMMQTFVEDYNSWRGYGRGTRVLIDAFRQNSDYEHLVEHLFPGGSWGNGAAMRAAPVGLRFWRDHDLLWQQARLSAMPTHRNILGIEGAQLMALATALAVTQTAITPASIADVLMTRVTTTVFNNRLQSLRELSHDSELGQFGNGIEAHESVVTAIGCFALYPDSFEDAVATALWQGGDTDTIAAMTGALAGARLGVEAINESWISNLEDTIFPERVHELSRNLFHASDAQ